MKYAISGIMFVLCFCTDPGAVSKEPLRVFMENDIVAGESRSLAALAGLVEGSQKSIECALSDLDAGYALEVEAKTTPQEKTLRDIAGKILARRDAGVDVALVFDIDQKCVSTGALFFQYPGFFLSSGSYVGGDTALRYKDMIGDCSGKNTGVTINQAEVLSSVKQKGLSPNREIYFVNPDGDMSDNFCVFDKETAWFSLQPLSGYSYPGRVGARNRPGVSFVLNAPANAIIAAFTKEIEMLKNFLTGSFKKPWHLTPDYDVSGSAWHVLSGPQDNPAEYLASLLESAESVQAYSTGVDFNLQSPAVKALVDRFQNSTQTDILFSDTSAFGANSLLQGFFLAAGGYCGKNPGACPAHVKYLNRIPSGYRAHVFFLKDTTGGKKVVLYNGNLVDSRDKHSDTALVETDSGVVYDALRQSWNSWFQGQDARGIGGIIEPGSIPGPGEIVLNELVWMGSVDNFRNAHTSDEAVEIYNTAGRLIDVSGLIVACTGSLNGDTVDSFFTIPEGVAILPGQYYTMAAKSTGAFSGANLVVPGLAIGNSSRECLLVENRTPAQVYHPAASTGGHYNDPRLTGVILDRVGKYSGEAFNANASQFFSRTGLNTTKYGIEGEGVRSMERISPGADGRRLENWKMNTFTPQTNLAPAGYLFHTFASLGFENSPAPESADSSVVISEVHWMGSYDKFLVSYASDEFVELYNRSANVKNIGGWVFGCSTDTAGANGKPLFGIPYGVTLQPGQFVVIQRTGALAFLKVDHTLDFTLNNTITQCLLTDGNVGATVFSGSDANGDGLMSGHYDSPLFQGVIADTVSNRSATLASLGLGVNNTTLKIRRSCERVDVNLPGDLSANWRASSVADPWLNTGIHLDYRDHTFASPGW